METIRKNKGDKQGIEGSYGMLSCTKYKSVYKSNFEIQVVNHMMGAMGCCPSKIISEFGIEPYPLTAT